MNKPSLAHVNLIRFLQKDDRWLEINEPEDLQNKILNYIDRNIYNRFLLLKIFKYASVSLFSLSILLSTILILNQIKPMKVIFIYPHSDRINNVEIIGNFNNPRERVKMELDPENGIWMGVIHVRNKKLNDYEINVEEKDDALPDTPGNEHSEAPAY